MTSKCLHLHLRMFPLLLKKRKRDIIPVIMSDNYRAYEKLLVIYYAYHNNNSNFGFTHFLEWCKLTDYLDNISLRNMITMFDNNKKWDILRSIDYDYFDNQLSNLSKYT